MWSRKPMPVHIQICCEGESWDAWVSSVCAGMGEEDDVESGKWDELGRRSSEPPSRDKET